MSDRPHPAMDGDLPKTSQMDDGETADARVLDPEAYTQKRRLRDIYDARAHVAKVEQKAVMEKGDPRQRGFGELEARRMILSAVQGFITQVEPLMVENYADIGEKYWKEVDLGSVMVEPPEEMTEEGSNPTIYNGYDTLVEPATPEVVDFKGVGSLLNADTEIQRTFEAKKEKRKGGGAGKVREVVERCSTTIPRQIAMKAFRQTNLFLAEIGLDLDREDDGGEWEI